MWRMRVGVVRESETNIVGSSPKDIGAVTVERSMHASTVVPIAIHAQAAKCCAHS